MGNDSRKTKSQLINELKMYSTLLEKGSDGIIVLQNGLVKFANAKAAEITGFSIEDVLGKPFIDFVAPQSRELVIDRYNRRLAGEEIPNKYEMGLLNKDGSLISVEVNAGLIEYDGKPATLSMVRDITERKIIENSLKESETRYRTLFETAAEGILAADMETRKFLYANPAVCRMLGYSHEELTKMSVMDIHPRDSLEQVLVDFDSLARGERDDVVVPCKKKDGSIFYVNIVAAASTIAGRLCNIGFFTDITERRAIEEKLKDSEIRYRRLFETAQDAILILNGDTGRIIDANPFIKDLLGFSLEELLGKNLWEIGEFKDTLASKISYQELHESGYKRWDNLPLVTKDRRRISVEVVANAYQVDHTPVIQCNIRDISARKRMEEILEKTGKLNTTLLESAGEGIYGLDLEGVTTFVNPAAARMIGWETGDLIGKKQHDILHHSHPDGSPYDKKKCPIYAAFKDGKVHHVDNEVFWRKDGSSFPVEYTSTPVWENGRLAGAVVVFADITERKKTEETIKLQAELLDKELDSVYLTDFEGNFIYVNKAAYVTHGYTREELLNMTLKNLDDTESAKLIAPRLKEIFEKGVATFEVNHLHKDGSLIPLEIHASKIEVGGKQVILSVAHNIAERREVQQQLVAQDRLASIGQLVSGVAHELNNPLTSVIGFSELLLQRELPDDVKADLKIVNDEARRTSLIVKNLLTFARQQPHDKLAVSINEVIQTVLRVRHHDHSTNNITVNTHLAPDLPRIIGNGSQLQQVFFNIITNAEQAMLEARDKGTLTVTTERVGNIVKARFTDDGPGISPENMKRLFSPFFTTKEIGKGTGLGLSICHGIIAEHGGKIWVDSEPGEGATFIIELPIPP